MAAARKRLLITREEKDQFDEANNQILEHLKTKVLPDFLSHVQDFIAKKKAYRYIHLIANIIRKKNYHDQLVLVNQKQMS